MNKKNLKKLKDDNPNKLNPEMMKKLKGGSLIIIIEDNDAEVD